MQNRELFRSWSRCSSWIAAALAASTVACGSDDGAPPAPPPAGSLVTWAGDGSQGHDGGSRSRIASWLNQPMELAFAGDGTALIVDWNNHCVREVSADGILSDVIGTAIPGDWPCQDQTKQADPSQCEVPLDSTVDGLDLGLNHPMDVIIEDDGFVLAAWHNRKIEHYDAATGDVSVLSGGQNPGPVGDGGPAAAARLNFPGSIVRQSDGGLLVSDQRTNRVRRIAPDGIITTVAGVPPPPPPPMTMPPTPPTPTPMGVLDDGVQATTAQLALTTSDKLAGADNPPPGGAIVLGGDGTLFIADTFHHCVRSVAPGADGIVGAGAPEEETITTVAGTCGTNGYSGDGGQALDALLNHPFDLEFGPDGALYLADTANHVVRKVDLSSGIIDLVAGTGSSGYSGEALPATQSKLREPYGLAFDAEGTLFIVDTMNNRIREIVQ